MVALVGHNGAGQTTLLNLLVGLIKPTEGSASMLGGQPAASPAALDAVGYVAQEAPLYQNLTVGETLRVIASLNRRWDQKRAETRLAELGIPLSRRVRRMSGGQGQAQLALPLALARRPKLLVLDEPLAMLDPLGGGPMVARELEAGTFRLSWTQGCGRTRWLLARFPLLAVAVTAGAAAVSVMFSWYYQPMFQLGQASPLAPQVFDLRGFDFAAWTLAAFAISVCAGALIRRTIPAIVAALAAAGTGHGAPWVLTQWWIQPGGAPASQSEISSPSGQLRQAGDLPTPQAVQQWSAEQGYIKYFTYQPASRFWHFQLIEGGWLLLLPVLLGAATVWLIRHRAA